MAKLKNVTRDLYGEATEIAGVDNVARAKKQGSKTREWTSRHEEAGVDIARVDNVARRSKGGQRGSGQGGTKKHNAGVSDRENNVLVALSLHA